MSTVLSLDTFASRNIFCAIQGMFFFIKTDTPRRIRWAVICGYSGTDEKWKQKLVSKPTVSLQF